MGAQQEPRVLVVARSNLLAEALAQLLASRGIVATVATPQTLTAALSPVVVAVVELDPSNAESAATIDAVHMVAPGVRLVALEPRAASEQLGQRLRPDAWITPQSPVSALVAAVEQLALGLPAPAHLRTPPRPRGNAAPGELRRLTPRELDVLRALAAGARTAAIGAQLQISEHTVRTHLRNIRAKLVVRTSLEAATVARRLGISSGGAGPDLEGVDRA